MYLFLADASGLLSKSCFTIYWAGKLLVMQYVMLTVASTLLDLWPHLLLCILVFLVTGVTAQFFYWDAKHSVSTWAVVLVNTPKTEKGSPYLQNVSALVKMNYCLFQDKKGSLFINLPRRSWCLWGTVPFWWACLVVQMVKSLPALWETRMARALISATRLDIQSQQWLDQTCWVEPV